MKKKSSFPYTVVILLLFFVLCLIPRTRLKLRSGFERVTSPFSAELSNLGQRVKSKFAFIGNIGKLKKQNEDLSQKIVDLQIDRSQIEELKNENALLKKELGFVSADQSNTLVPAKIIQRDPATFLDNIVIDKGSDQGIGVGMAVVARGTLVGQVSEAHSSTAVVTLVTSKSSIVQAMLQNSRAKGILRGGISGLYLENIVRDTDFVPGENIVTSGLGGDIKQGILIGRAGKLESALSGIFKTIEVEPIVSISDLELVFVQK